MARRSRALLVLRTSCCQCLKCGASHTASMLLLACPTGACSAQCASSSTWHLQVPIGCIRRCAVVGRLQLSTLIITYRGDAAAKEQMFAKEQKLADVTAT
jgi:hypothetical protein